MDESNLNKRNDSIKDYVKKIILNEDYEIELFLKIFPLFKSKKTLIQIWIELYKEIYTNNRDENRERLIQFILQFVSNKNTHCSKEDIDSLIETLKPNKEHILLIDKIKKIVSETTNLFGILKKSLSDNFYTNNYISISPQDLANELTVICVEYYKKINFYELITIVDKGDHKQHHELSELTDLCEKFGYLVPSEILKEKNPKKQIIIAHYFIQLSNELKVLRNYHMLYSILIGLSNHYLQTIPYLWEDEEYKIMFNSLSTIISPLGNFTNYRKELNDNKDEIIIPYIGLILADIQHLLEYDFITSDNIINEHVIDYIGNYITKIKKYKCNYTIESNKSIRLYITQLFTNTSQNDLHEFYKLHKTRTKGSSFNDILRQQKNSSNIAGIGGIRRRATTMSLVTPNNVYVELERPNSAML